MDMSNTPEGFFVDWDGQLRSTTDCGGGYRCEVDLPAKYVAVMSPKGALVHEATFYKDQAAVEKAGSEFTASTCDTLLQRAVVPGEIRFVQDLHRNREEDPVTKSSEAHSTPWERTFSMAERTLPGRQPRGIPWDPTSAAVGSRPSAPASPGPPR